MALEIEVRGLERLVRRLGAFEVFALLRPAMIRGVARVVNAMADYPPAPEGSWYIRTGTLGRRWTQTQPSVSEGATELRVAVGNNTVYGAWVQNAQFQAWMHRGRWQTDEQELDRAADPLVAELNALVQAELARMGE